MPNIVAAEAAGVQDWIVGRATELRVIRGGSLLLDRVFKEIAAELSSTFGPGTDPRSGVPTTGWVLVTLSSGSLTAVFAHSHEAEQAATMVRRTVQRGLPALPVAVGTGDWDGSEDRYAAARFTALRNSQGATPSPALYVLGSETCDACGSATASSHGTGPDRWHLCTDCQNRARMVPDSGDGAPSDGPQDEEAETAVTVEDTRIVYRMDEIGRATRSARWRGYVAVLRADGNNIGQRFAGAHGMRAASEISQRLHDDVGAAVKAGLAAAVEAHRKVDGTTPMPFNPVMIAGDDMVMILPAHVALSAAVALTTAKLTACAGVLICHQTLPFNVAVQSADELLDSAKRAARRACAHDPPAYLAWAVESGSQPRSGLGSHQLTVSPCAAKTAKILLDSAIDLSLPTTAVRKIAEDLLCGGRVAERAWELLVRRRLGTSDAQADKGRLEEVWQALDAKAELAKQPWPAQDGRRSPLGDLQLFRTLARTNPER